MSISKKVLIFLIYSFSTGVNAGVNNVTRTEAVIKLQKVKTSTMSNEGTVMSVLLKELNKPLNAFLEPDSENVILYQANYKVKNVTNQSSPRIIRLNGLYRSFHPKIQQVLQENKDNVVEIEYKNDEPTSVRFVVKGERLPQPAYVVDLKDIDKAKD